MTVDRKLYGLRTLIGRCFNKPRNARCVATRYDKTPESFPRFIDITSPPLAAPFVNMSLGISRTSIYNIFKAGA